ncbi:MAG: beta-ketoacyl-[acyl-carrier-protein] synthase family protein [Pirellulales bacterium]|nr:beta-ketoacyl-[acyl-carrier-protein] synthase family protein [Pirellulales bacterium]
MPLKKDIVVTGLGIVSPIGIGAEAFWTALGQRRSGVRRLDLFTADDLPVPFGGAVVDFDPKTYVRPRKSLKVMSRDIQLGFTAADLACQHAGHHRQAVDPERFGTVFGAEMIPCELPEMVPTYRSCLVEGRFDFQRWGPAAMSDLFPLWMLKYLPNMPACHIGIAQDARGPCNTLTLGDVSGLSATAEAVRVLDRGQADAMLAGGVGSRIHPTTIFRGAAHELSRCAEEPERACRPFDARRDGIVNGEGAAAVMLETLPHAQARGTAVLARILGFGSAFEPTANGVPLSGQSLRAALHAALQDAGLAPSEIGAVFAHGVSTLRDDPREAQALRDVLGDVPVTALKSYFGHCGAASGALDLVAAVLSLGHGVVPPTLNYENPDPHCPINVVHGDGLPLQREKILLLSHTQHGQATALVIGAL